MDQGPNSACPCSYVNNGQIVLIKIHVQLDFCLCLSKISILRCEDICPYLHTIHLALTNFVFTVDNNLLK